MHQINVDWSTITSVTELWVVLCREAQEPEWHGRNLNALRDSWITGGINPTGPPYVFSFINCGRINPDINEIAIAVMEIASDSVQANGGSYCTA